jgi:hypothetical protein
VSLAGVIRSQRILSPGPRPGRLGDTTAFPGLRRCCQLIRQDGPSAAPSRLAFVVRFQGDGEDAAAFMLTMVEHRVVALVHMTLGTWQPATSSDRQNASVAKDHPAAVDPQVAEEYTHH